VAVGDPADIADDTIVHRVGGGQVDNLRLSPVDAQLTPPGLSVLRGGTPHDALRQIREQFPRSKKWRAVTSVGTITAGAIRHAGFDIVPDGTARFPNHARIVHRDGVPGFSDEKLAPLSQAMTHTEC
jgi:hypothetical protein